MSLSKEIINGDLDNLKRRLELGANPCEYDPYGYNPLIVSIMTGNEKAFEILLSFGSDVNQADIFGQSPLHWAVKCENLALVKKLVQHKAVVQATSMEQEPLLTLPILRKKSEILQVLTSYGGKKEPAEDFILAKSLGHYFDLFGLGLYLNHNNIVTLFEYQGFKLEFALSELCNHWQLYHQSYDKEITEALTRALKIRDIKTYHRKRHQENITSSIGKMNFFPIALEGHALSICHNERYLAFIDRSHGAHQPIEIYKIYKPVSLEMSREILFSRKTRSFKKSLLYSLQAEIFLSLSLPRQVIGNCTWANLEAAPLVLSLLQSLSRKKNISQKELSESYKNWYDWSRPFFFKEALLKINTLEGDRQTALCYTLCQIICVSELGDDILAMFKTFVEKNHLEKFVNIFFEIAKREEHIAVDPSNLLKKLSL